MSFLSNNQPVRYRVRAVCQSEDVAKKLISWMQEEHGADLLAVPGCIEYRVYLVSPAEVHCEYLFETDGALKDYYENQAGLLREKGRAVFGETAEFSRDESVLVGCGPLK